MACCIVVVSRLPVPRLQSMMVECCLLQDCIVRSTIASNINKEVMLASSNGLVVVGNQCVCIAIPQGLH